MSRRAPREPTSGDRRLGWLLAALFLAAMVLGAGPGIWLANRPATWLGLPRLYLWGLLWCSVEAAIVVAAYVWVWRSEDGGDAEAE